MIELNVITAAGQRPVLLNIDNIGSMSTGIDRQRTSTIVTRDGRELQVASDYATVRAAILRVRSAFETLIGGTL